MDDLMDQARAAANAADLVGDPLPPVELVELALLRLKRGYDDGESIPGNESLLAACQVIAAASKPLLHGVRLLSLIAPYVARPNVPTRVDVDDAGEFLLAVAHNIHSDLIGDIKYGPGSVSTVLDALRNIEKGYADGMSMCDDEMMGHVETVLGDFSAEVLAVFEAISAGDLREAAPDRPSPFKPPLTYGAPYQDRSPCLLDQYVARIYDADARVVATVHGDTKDETRARMAAVFEAIK